MQNKQIPVYIDDFGDYDVRNIPMSLGMRMELVKFLRECRQSRELFGTFYCVEAKPIWSKLIATLLIPLTTCLKYRSRRQPTVDAITAFETDREKQDCQSVHEKNLKPNNSDDEFNYCPSLVDLITSASIMCVIYALIFITSII